ncbi:hypothetical protein [Bacillus cereus]|uniref:hypothetical protein n=1 Tax=Bacillus cereus TaxID=1396 RepID=UPI00397F0EAA
MKKHEIQPSIFPTEDNTAVFNFDVFLNYLEVELKNLSGAGIFRNLFRYMAIWAAKRDRSGLSCFKRPRLRGSKNIWIQPVPFSHANNAAHAQYCMFIVVLRHTHLSLNLFLLPTCMNK